jgi:hypothetical protein
MTDSAVRIENLLLLSPFVFLFLLTSLMPDLPVSVIFFDDNIVLSPVEATAVLLILVLIPYLFHYILRKTNNGNLFILHFHVILSFLLIAFLPIAYYNVPLVPKGWVKAQFPLAVIDKWDSTMHVVSVMWITYLVLQSLFIGYCIYLFIERKWEG